MPSRLNYSRMEIPKIPAETQWACDGLPARKLSDIQLPDWRGPITVLAINGVPVYRPPFIKTGAYRQNRVATAVYAAIWLRAL